MISSSLRLITTDIHKPSDGSPAPATSLFFNTIDTPVPTKSQALVRIHAFGLNRMDLLQRQGNYPVPPQAPATLGVEFSGVIVSLGSAASDGGHSWKVDDEVLGLAYGGAYAEYIVVSTRMLVHKPKELSWVQCASIPEVWITASQALYLVGEFSKGKSVLWHAGASSVSIAGIQLAKSEGASAVFATVRQDEKVKFCVEELGCTAAWNTTKEDWAKGIKDATGGKGVDLVIDFVGAPNFKDNLDALARDGRWVVLGLMGGAELPEKTNIAPLLLKRIRIEGSTLRSRDEEYQGKLRDMLEEHALPKFKDGSFKILVEKEMDWKNIIEAHQLMEKNVTKGKIVCTIPWE
jgi:putative PIG3 family NAD(P)H quinone oxidoreductase